jgi:hypothetical protein
LVAAAERCPLKAGLSELVEQNALRAVDCANRACVRRAYLGIRSE